MHGRAVRIRSGTTHPEFVELFKSLFADNGHIRMYPKLAKVTPAEWNLEVDPNGSFEFLLEKNIDPVPEGIGDRRVLTSFLAGSLMLRDHCFHKKEYSPSFELSISNANVELLNRLQELLAARDYHSKIYCDIKTMLTSRGPVECKVWKLTFTRFVEVKRLLMKLPLRHKEKVTKARIALSYMNFGLDLNSERIPEVWQQYIDEIKRGCQSFIDEALRVMKARRCENIMPGWNRVGARYSCPISWAWRRSLASDTV